MEWALSLIRQLLVIPKAMMPLPHHWWHLFGLVIIVIWLFSLLVAFVAPSGTMRVGPQGRGFWVCFSFISQSPVPEVCGAFNNRVLKFWDATNDYYKSLYCSGNLLDFSGQKIKGIFLLPGVSVSVWLLRKALTLYVV